MPPITIPVSMNPLQWPGQSQSNKFISHHLLLCQLHKQQIANPWEDPHLGFPGLPSAEVQPMTFPIPWTGTSFRWKYEPHKCLLSLATNRIQIRTGSKSLRLLPGLMTLRGRHILGRVVWISLTGIISAYGSVKAQRYIIRVFTASEELILWKFVVFLI